jgi:TRAP-type C4-dicarboxylate transport system substrate-binding protein
MHKQTTHGSHPARLFLVVLLTAALLLAGGTTADAAKRLGKARHTIKVATLAPDGSTWMDIFHEMNAEVYEKTGQQVKFKVYPGGVLGNESDVIRKIRVGQVHGSAFTGGGLTEIYPDLRVLGLPLLFQSHAEFNHVLDKLGPRVEQEFGKKGYVVLGWPQLGFTYCFSRRDIRSVADLRAGKPWMWGTDPIMSSVFKQARVNPVSVDVGDVLTGLQTGLLDTAFNTPLGVIALQWFTRLETMTDLPLTYSTGGFLVTKKAFGKLTPELQQTVKEVCAKHIDRLTEETRREDKAAVEVFKKEGIRVLEPTPEGMQEFRALSRGVTDQLKGKAFSAEIHELVMTHLNEYRRAQGGE